MFIDHTLGYLGQIQTVFFLRVAKYKIINLGKERSANRATQVNHYLGFRQALPNLQLSVAVFSIILIRLAGFLATKNKLGTIQFPYYVLN